MALYCIAAFQNLGEYRVYAVVVLQVFTHGECEYVVLSNLAAVFVKRLSFLFCSPFLFSVLVFSPFLLAIIIVDSLPS